MKTAISIPDELFAEADALAKALNTSRSELYCLAMREYLARHSRSGITEALNRVYGAGDEDEEEYGFLEAAARQVLQNSEW